MKLIIYSALMIVMFIGCTGPEKRGKDRDDLILEGEMEVSESIDVDQLQSNLNLNRPLDSLGFSQKRFNTCSVGAGYSESHNCRKRYFGVLNFKIFCRSTTGTVEQVTNSELRPLHADQVKVIFGGITGYSSINNGYGQARGISRSSFRNKYLILKINDNALRVKVADTDRIIVPGDWCA